MDDVVLLQTGPDSFEVRVTGYPPVQAVLQPHTRQGLGGSSVPPVVVATEIVRFLLEHDAWPPTVQESLGAAVGRIPGFVDELQGRLA